jgi:hypothetical protein
MQQDLQNISGQGVVTKILNQQRVDFIPPPTSGSAVVPGPGSAVVPVRGPGSAVVPGPGPGSAVVPAPLRPDHPPPIQTDFADDSSTVSEHTKIHVAPLSDRTKQFEEQVKRERAGSELPNWTKNLHENFFRPEPKKPGINTSTNTSPLPNSDDHT